MIGAHIVTIVCIFLFLCSVKIANDLIVLHIEKFGEQHHYKIDEFLPRISAQRLISKYSNYQGKYFSDYFEIDHIVNPLPTIKKCFSVSLFAQDSTNRFPNEHGPIDYKSENGRWYKKYMTPFLDGLKTITPGWKVRVFTEPQLYQWFIMLLDTKHISKDRIEFYVMKNNSVGAQPGAMWRFLSIDDKSLDICYIVDIDDTSRNSVQLKPENHPLLEPLEQYKHVALATYGKSANIVNGHMFDYNNSDINYPDSLILSTLWACFLVCRPSNIHFDIKQTMLCFFHLMSLAEEQNLFVCRKKQKDPKNPYFKPTNTGPCGFGTHIHVYGFDEFYLRSVVFHELVRKGSLLVRNMDAEYTCDPRVKTYLQQYNNIVIDP